MKKLKAGDIILFFSDKIYPPKRKYGIITNPEKRWCFLINSDDRDIYSCIPILKKDHAFLRQDSFISCSNFIIYPEIVDKLLGELSDQEKKVLMNHLTDNVKTISKSNKQEIASVFYKK